MIIKVKERMKGFSVSIMCVPALKLGRQARQQPLPIELPRQSSLHILSTNRLSVQVTD